jgi:hypothetical protein
VDATPTPEALSNPCPGALSAGSDAVPISSLSPGRALYPASSQLLSAYTFVVTDLGNAESFEAFGFDLRSQCLMFHVSGDKRRGELDLLHARIAEDLRVIEQRPDTDSGFVSQSSGQIGGPLIPRPGI